ncbi:hypothetical protein NSP16_24315, partial [Salmonella enterica]|nr:hypothetical protein [Salmonella enterica]
ARAVAQLALGRLEEAAGALRQLGGVDAVRFQGGGDELFALQPVAGVQGIGGSGDGAEYRKREHQAA